MEGESREEYFERVATGPGGFYADLYDSALADALELHDVYTPADDTFLMIEVILEDFFGDASGRDRVHPNAALRCDRARGPAEAAARSGPGAGTEAAPGEAGDTRTDLAVLEVGSGSGLISAAVMRHMLQLAASASADDAASKLETALRDLHRSERVLNTEGYSEAESTHPDVETDGFQEDFRPMTRFDSRQRLHAGDEATFAMVMAEAGQKRSRMRALARSNESEIHFYATDKNPVAIECSSRVLQRELQRWQGLPKKFGNTVLQARFADAPALSGRTFDLIVFNPPYVVTDDPSELQGDGISISWAGGTDGREVIDDFIAEVSRLLSRRGKLYLCGMRENRPSGVIKYAQQFGLAGELLRVADCGCEELWVIVFGLAQS